MCGIIAYIGDQEALPRLIEGLRRLEYRGYDSAGVALIEPDGVWLRRAVGRVAGLAAETSDGCTSKVGIAHTRWATHGGVTLENTHPHLDATHRIAVVHNGIIENMEALKAVLIADGVEFLSETDTEVLPHLIRRHYTGDPLEAVRAALSHVHGTYGIAVAFADHPDVLIAARFGSPLVIGLGDGETVLASDPQAIVAHTRRVLYLDDREIAVISADGAKVQRLSGGDVNRDVSLIEADYAVAELGGHEHFMAKEIWEQPDALLRCLRGRVQIERGNAKLGGLNMTPRDMVNIREVVTVGCGTAYHAGMVGSMAIEHLARLPAHAEVASEFRNRHPIIPPDALYFAVSQSGETADTLGAVEEILVKGGQVMGVVNVVGSSIARTCGAGVYVYAGPEIAVASTKAFTSQVTALLVFTLMLARTRNQSLAQGENIARALLEAPDKLQEYLDDPGPIDAAADLVKDAKYCMFMGRGFSYPVALEGALKLKEISYVPCEAYPAGEMKHGPIAMLEDGTPVIVIAPRGSQRDKVISNIKEVQARGARTIIVHTRGDDEMARLADVSIPVPEVREFISPLLTVVPLQLLAYKVGIALGRDIDKPRNLAKSVTVE
ncbi:MAG: glutamine--fructose-6-phosphate transaminase (isomerizing) [Proteobacteria bacterium]|nr:glutamine--fructose-6-phosphate transaminase (isomerizing) [Pseudomonadota bacterium]